MFAGLKQSKTVKSEISVDNKQERPPIVDGGHDVNASTYRKETQSFFFNGFQLLTSKERQLKVLFKGWVGRV